MTEDENKQPIKEKKMTTETKETAAKPAAAKPATKKPAPKKPAAPKAKKAEVAAPIAAPISTEKKTIPLSKHLTPPPLVKPIKPAPKPANDAPDIPSHVSHHNEGAKKNIRNNRGSQQRKKPGNFQNRKRHDRNSNSPSGGGGGGGEYIEPSLPELPEGVEPTFIKISDLQKMSFEQLVKYANHVGITILTNLSRSEIIVAVVKLKINDPSQVFMTKGTLEILPDGFGFLRSPDYNYLSSAEDIYVSPAQIRHYGLRKGDEVQGPLRVPKDKDKYFALLRVDTINDKKPAEMANRKAFVNFTPIFPTSRLMMETEKNNYSTRVIDLVSPVGKGQRALIVAPPKAGKTILLQNIMQGIVVNNPDVKLLVLLIDERPEEVTDMKRLLGDKGQVIGSTFDEPPERHCVVAEMCIEKAKRLVETGEDVVIILDSITRLARAYNTVQPHSGKILSGGVDANAMHKPKRFFGAARNLEEGGSLTIIGSALIDTGSKMDEVIYEEFKGTGNLELVLDRRLADRRLYPAIDVIKSGTRKEDLLYHKEELEKVYKLRAALADLSPTDAMNLLLSRMKKTTSNTEFLLSMKD